MAAGDSRRSPWPGVLAAASALGAADVLIFVVAEPSVALKTPGRAAGSLAGLGVWLMLTGVAAYRWRDRDGDRLSRASVVLAGLAAADGVGLAAIHLAAHVGGLRSAVGGVAGAIALTSAVLARRAG